MKVGQRVVISRAIDAYGEKRRTMYGNSWTLTSKTRRGFVAGDVVEIEALSEPVVWEGHELPQRYLVGSSLGWAWVDADYLESPADQSTSEHYRSMLYRALHLSACYRYWTTEHGNPLMKYFPMSPDYPDWRESGCLLPCLSIAKE